MQETKNNSSTAQGLPKKTASIGAILANGRKTAALSQTDVAEQINLPKHIIEALEVDNYDNLPEPIYISGYLRNYARVVGINEEDLVKLYKEQHHREPIVETNKKSKQSYDPAALWSTAAVLSILVGLVITWWFDYNTLPGRSIELVDVEAGRSRENANKTQAKEILAENDKNVVTEKSISNKSNERSITEVDESPTLSLVDENEQNTNRVVEVVTADQQQAMEDESQNPKLVSSVDGAQVLTVTYVEKSWTEIRDADSNTLMQGLIEPGVVRDLSGKPPFEIFLGNAPGVVIEVNGLYFDHSQYSRSNRTARFQVSSGSLN